MTARTPAAGSQAVDRAAALLALIVQSDDARSFTSLVDELGLAKSTTSRLLQALERNRLVQRDRAGTFRPGALFAVYAARQSTVHDLVELAQPVLNRLAAATGETVNLAVPRGNSVVAVAQVDGRYLLGATNWVGIEVPPHCSALGKVFYAFGRIALPRGEMERRTAATITSADTLRRELVEVRRRGGPPPGRSSNRAWSPSPHPSGRPTAPWSPPCRSRPRQPGSPASGSAPSASSSSRTAARSPPSWATGWPAGARRDRRWHHPPRPVPPAPTSGRQERHDAGEIFSRPCTTRRSSATGRASWSSPPRGSRRG